MATRSEAVVLAAGLSSRCPEYKLTLPLGGMTLIERTLAPMLVCVDLIHVVLGHNDDVLRPILANYAQVDCVLNPGYAEGMFSSVRAGLALTSAEQVLIQPGDVPLVSEGVYRALLTSRASVAIPVYEGRKGHPLLLRQEVVRDVLAAPATATLRDVIARWGFTPVPVPDPAILWDVDTLEDYQRLLQLYQESAARGAP